MQSLKCFTKLDPGKTLFLLCDVQEKFRKAMPLFSHMVQNISKLLQVGNILEIPLIVTEQYPKGLGNTVQELNISHALAVIPKTKFSMYLPELLCYIKEEIPTKPLDVVLFGLETHVCVLQTSVDFLENDYKVHIVADCCCSRLNQDRDIGLELLQQIGCFVQTSESVIFNLTQDKENPHFKAVQKAVSAVSADMEIAKVPQKNLASSLKKGNSKQLVANKHGKKPAAKKPS